MAIEAMSSLPDDDNSDEPGADAVNQISLGDFVKPAQAAAQRRSAQAKRAGRSLWIREAEVCTQADHGSADQRCRNLDLYGISGDVR